MNFKSYDKLIILVADLLLEHRYLTDEELDKSVKKTFKIDQATLTEMEEVCDLTQVGRE
jgi:hypothetical protein